MKRRLRDGIRTTPASGDLVVYDAGDDSVHVLNPVGKLILEAHLDGRTVAEIEVMVKKAFALVPAKAHPKGHSAVCRRPREKKNRQ